MHNELYPRPPLGSFTLSLSLFSSFFYNLFSELDLIISIYLTCTAYYWYWVRNDLS
jgi:hypothetical protein